MSERRRNPGIPDMSGKITQRLVRVETAFQQYEGSTPETSLSRVMVDAALCEEFGLEKPPDRVITYGGVEQIVVTEDGVKSVPEGIPTEIRYPGEAKLVWCLSLGPYRMPKAFFYGDSIEECLRKAETEAVAKKRALWTEALKDPRALTKIGMAMTAHMRTFRATSPRPPVPDMPYIPGVTKPLDERGRSE